LTSTPWKIEPVSKSLTWIVIFTVSDLGFGQPTRPTHDQSAPRAHAPLHGPAVTFPRATTRAVPASFAVSQASKQSRVAQKLEQSRTASQSADAPHARATSQPFTAMQLWQPAAASGGTPP
jgi:hypothetical protein